ncbi:hypothetical protein [Hyphomicrobium sp.]|uniref:hypothetical protein n=1 Tax=Hyphomicrobium sp. TaxID=82 RepID=UPI002FDE3924
MMMIMRKFQSGPFAERARRSARGIAVAMLLTLAALVFVVSAIHDSGSKTASISSPERSASRSN